MKTTTRPRVGDEAWFVEWCSALAFYDDDPTGDVDRDRCTTSRRRAKSREDAEVIAREVWPIASKTWGVVEFWPATFMAYDEEDADLYPGAGHWVEDAESEYYEGDDGGA